MTSERVIHAGGPGSRIHQKMGYKSPGRREHLEAVLDLLAQDPGMDRICALSQASTNVESLRDEIIDNQAETVQN